ncbi:MAG: hypothetical protein MRY74_11320 [Neomegalonema sp.]|nr:hypothetical protein [Neomegalonema sp.]
MTDNAVAAARASAADRAAGSEPAGRLIARRSFLPLFIVQALGAFNDNIFKTAFVSLMTYILAAKMEMDVELLVPVAAAVFILPFAFLAPFAGQIADRVDKAKMMQWVKFAELILMGIAAVAYISQSTPLLFLLLFLMGAQSAFFSPIKYGVLPQYLHRSELVKGNGLIQAATFVAILGGTIAGTNLVLTPIGAEVVSAVVVAVALIGWAASWYAPPAPRASGVAPFRAAGLIDGSLHLRRWVGEGLSLGITAGRFAVFFALWAAIYAGVEMTIFSGGPMETLLPYKGWVVFGSALFIYLLYLLWPSIIDSLDSARRSRASYNAIRAIAWFWFVGASYLAVLPILASKQLLGDQTVLTLLLAAFSVGIGIGSILTGLIYRGGVKIAFAPWGAVGIAIFSLDLAFIIDVQPDSVAACALTFEGGAIVPKEADGFLEITRYFGAAYGWRSLADMPLSASTCIDVFQFLSKPVGWRILFDFVALTTCAGVYLTPLNAVYQAEAPEDARGRVVACSNMIDSTFMALSSVAIVVLGMAGLSEQEMLGLLGVTGVFAAFVVARWAPETKLGKAALAILPAAKQG